jgi:hypothetical protein
MCSWHGLKGKIGKGMIYEKVCWRRVVINRGNEMMKTLSIFLNEIEGHAYSLGYAKLVLKQSSKI